MSNFFVVLNKIPSGNSFSLCGAYIGSSLNFHFGTSAGFLYPIFSHVSVFIIFKFGKTNEYFLVGSRIF